MLLPPEDDQNFAYNRKIHQQEEDCIRALRYGNIQVILHRDSLSHDNPVDRALAGIAICEGKKTPGKTKRRVHDPIVHAWGNPRGFSHGSPIVQGKEADSKEQIPVIMETDEGL